MNNNLFFELIITILLAFSVYKNRALSRSTIWKIYAALTLIASVASLINQSNIIPQQINMVILIVNIVIIAYLYFKHHYLSQIHLIELIYPLWLWISNDTFTYDLYWALCYYLILISLKEKMKTS